MPIYTHLTQIDLYEIFRFHHISSYKSINFIKKLGSSDIRDNRSSLFGLVSTHTRLRTLHTKAAIVH